MKKILSSFFVTLFFVSIGSIHNLQAAIKGASQSAGSSEGGVFQSSGQSNAPEGTPTWEIQEIERRMEEYDTSPGISAAQKQRNRQIKREILNGTFDLRELSRLALDKHWNNISAAEQSNFVSLMTSLLETKAIFSKEQSKTQGKSYQISYKGDKYSENKSRARSLTEIYVPKENITLGIEYKLKKNGKNWHVFDIIVDNASLVENYRYQFNNIITKYSYQELVSRMRKKLQELKAG